MIIGQRLRELREEKKISRGEMEKRTGLLRCYICRVENGYTVPAVETLAKFANALKVPLYRLFHEGKEPPKLRNRLKSGAAPDVKESEFFAQFRRHLSEVDPVDRDVLLVMARKMAEGKGTKSPRPGRKPSTSV